MKAVIVMYDSLNRHMLPNYGCDWTIMPNFKRLTDKVATFDSHYVGSMPCMPARREMHTGRYNFLHRSWGPYEPFDDSTPEILKNNGVYSHLCSDHYHYWEDGGGTYHHRFSTWENIRGQEGDKWKGHVKDPIMPEHLGNMNRFDQINRSYFKKEEDTPQAKTFSSGLEFLETNKDADNWFLQIETFDPHEPFFTLQDWKIHYPHRWDGPIFDWPKYQRVSECKEAVEHIKYEYAALLTQCDHYLGKVMDAFDRHNLWEDTMLIVMTDHGFLLGEHDWWAKSVMPFYNEISHIPLFMWDPRSKVKGERRNSITQTIDIGPTLLDYFGIKIPEDMQGKPLKDVIASDTPVRQAAIFGIHGGHVNITDGNFVYMRAPNDANAPLFNYTHMPTHMNCMFSIEEMSKMEIHKGFSFTKGCPVMQIPSTVARKKRFFEFTTKLFDIKNDPGQINSIEDKENEERLIFQMIDILKQSDAPPEQYERLELTKYLK